MTNYRLIEVSDSKKHKRQQLKRDLWPLKKFQTAQLNGSAAVQHSTFKSSQYHSPSKCAVTRVLGSRNAVWNCLHVSLSFDIFQCLHYLWLAASHIKLICSWVFTCDIALLPRDFWAKERLLTVYTMYSVPCTIFTWKLDQGSLLKDKKSEALKPRLAHSCESLSLFL